MWFETIYCFSKMFLLSFTLFFCCHVLLHYFSFRHKKDVIFNLGSIHFILWIIYVFLFCFLCVFILTIPYGSSLFLGSLINRLYLFYPFCYLSSLILFTKMIIFPCLPQFMWQFFCFYLNILRFWPVQECFGHNSKINWKQYKNICWKINNIG